MRKTFTIIALFISFFAISQNKTLTDKEFVEKAMKAINAEDYQEIEFMRDQVKESHLPLLMKQWNASLPWSKKNGFIGLLMDQQSDVIKPLMIDALDSDMPENRAVAVCILNKDFSLHKLMYDKNGWVIVSKVDEEVAKCKKSLKKK